MTSNYASVPGGTHPTYDLLEFNPQLGPTELDIPNDAARAHQGQGEATPIFAAVAEPGVVKLYDVVDGQRVDMGTTTITTTRGTVPNKNDYFFAGVAYYDPATGTQYFTYDGYESNPGADARTSVSITACPAGIAVYKEEVQDNEGVPPGDFQQYRTGAFELAFLESDPTPAPSTLTIGAKTRRVTFSQS